MKFKHVIMASGMMLSVASFAQKDEMKTLKKLVDKDVMSSSDIVKFKQAVNTLSSMNGLSEEDKVYSDYYAAMVPMLEAMDAMQKNPNDQSQVLKILSAKNIMILGDAQTAVLDYEAKTKKMIYSEDIKQDIAQTKPMLLQFAYGLVQANKLKEATALFEAIYHFDKSDPSNLYNASVLAVQTQDNEAALRYYEELIKVNYTGEGTNYIAVNKANGQDENFASDKERAAAIKIGTHEKPRNEKIPSKRGEIMRNYASLLLQSGRMDDAKKAIAEAKKLSPDDTDLILAEANLYYESKDMEKYKQLVNEVIAKKPNDADLYFNLGVVSGNTGDVEGAKKYYEKAISINPNYFNAYNNLGAIYLADDSKIVNEMNSLGMSPKESKRYDELKAKRKKMYSQAVVYFEKALAIEPNNESVKSILLNAYQVLEMDAKYKALKAKK